MIEMKISKRGIKKVLKIVDAMKSAVMRCDRVMDLVKKNCTLFHEGRLVFLVLYGIWAEE